MKYAPKSKFLWNKNFPVHKKLKTVKAFDLVVYLMV